MYKILRCYINVYKSGVTPLKVIGNRRNWTLGREKGDKTENQLLIIAVFARELKETEVRNSQLNSGGFVLYVCLNRRGKWDVAESIARGSWNEVFIGGAQVIQIFIYPGIWKIFLGDYGNFSHHQC